LPKQELDLFQFASGRMAQARACPPQVKRCKGLYPDTIRARLYHVSNHILGDAGAPKDAVLADRPGQLASNDRNTFCSGVDGAVNPSSDRHRAYMAGFAHQIPNRLVVFATLDIADLQLGDFGPP
jgi:hypothetical protein